MVRSKALALIALMVLLGFPQEYARAQAPASDVEDLGEGRYRIGAIEIDQRAGRFSVPGAVLEIDTDAMPIEFLAVTRGGFKAYEATIELDTNAVAFNLACILIGLDAEHATPPAYHFDPAVLRGDAVDLRVRWLERGEQHEYPLGELLRNEGGPVTHDWVYIGSRFTEDGTYMAESFGTLIGVVHDPDSILQHRTGLGLGDYGAVTANPTLMPPAATRVEVLVSRSQVR
ncbi:MAG: YdjY domain-containing protein [Pseudomonadales bacterium]